MSDAIWGKIIHIEMFPSTTFFSLRSNKLEVNRKSQEPGRKLTGFYCHLVAGIHNFLTCFVVRYNEREGKSFLKYRVSD